MRIARMLIDELDDHKRDLQVKQAHIAELEAKLDAAETRLAQVKALAVKLEGKADTVHPVFKAEEEALRYCAREIRNTLATPAAVREHIFDPDSTLQDCSCGWKASASERETMEGAKDAWSFHSKGEKTPCRSAERGDAGMSHWPEIPLHLKEPIVFYDKNLGIAMVAHWEGEQWIFHAHNGHWCSVRKVSPADPTFIIEQLNISMPETRDVKEDSR